MNKKNKLQTQTNKNTQNNIYIQTQNKNNTYTKQMSTMRTVLTFALSLRGSIVDSQKQLKKYIHIHNKQQKKLTQHKQLH